MYSQQCNEVGANTVPLWKWRAVVQGDLPKVTELVKVKLEPDPRQSDVWALYILLCHTTCHTVLKLGVI